MCRSKQRSAVITGENDTNRCAEELQIQPKCLSMRQKNIRNPSGVRSRIVSISCLGVIVVKSVVFSVWPE
jgi:hypothetical protein